MTKHPPYRKDWQPLAIIIGIFLLIISSTLFSNDVSRVGIENGIIARGLHIGESDFWQPTYNVDMQKLEQVTLLPMGYWIQSTCMRLFGDGVMFDKIYSFIFFILSGVMLCACWRIMGNSRKLMWLPLIFAMLAPVITRASTGNYIEMPLTFFILSAVYWYLHAITHTMHRVRHGAYKELRTDATTLLPKRYSWSRGVEVAISGLCLVVAFFIKGGAGIFPIIMPALLWLLDPNRKGNWRPWVDLGIMVMMVVLSCIVLGAVDKNFLDGVATYWYNSIFGFPDYPATVASRFYIFYQVLVQLSIPLILCLLTALLLLREHRLRTYIFYWRHRNELSDADLLNMTMCYSFLICGCCGMVIMAFSLHQYDYYVIPLVPFFAVAMSCFVENGVLKLQERIGKIGHTIFTALAIGLLCGGVITFLTSATNMSRSTDAYSELNKMLPYLHEDEVISVSQGIYGNGKAALYLKRHKGVTFDSIGHREHLLAKYEEMDADNACYRKVELNTATYHLYQRIHLGAQDSAASQSVPHKVYESCSIAKRDSAVPQQQTETQKLTDSLQRTLHRLEAAEKALKEMHGDKPKVVPATSARKAPATVKRAPTTNAKKAATSQPKKRNYMPTYKDD